MLKVIKIGLDFSEDQQLDKDKRDIEYNLMKNALLLIWQRSSFHSSSLALEISTIAEVTLKNMGLDPVEESLK